MGSNLDPLTTRRRFLQSGAALAALASAPRLATADDNPRDRALSSNNLKQIGLALHNYLSLQGHFPPPAITDKEGKPLLSWRVAILPYIEQEPLYRQFKLDEPWDSPHNKALVAKMPKTYGPVGGKPKAAGETYYRVFSGPGALFDPKGPGTKLTDILDGTVNTFAVVEADEPVVWTKPEPLEFDPDGDLPKLGGLFEGGFHALTADGAGHFLKRDLNPIVLRALITRAGGEVIDWDAIR